jgi:hypothetical protein
METREKRNTPGREFMQRLIAAMKTLGTKEEQRYYDRKQNVDEQNSSSDADEKDTKGKS